MRAIKFRIWNEKLKKMWSWETIDRNRVFALDPKLESTDFMVIPNGPEHILMQFTGLKDKNGKEVFEQDIVKWTSTFKGAEQVEHIDFVKWDDENAGFYLHPWCHEIYAAEMEVIGNTYENPELLGGK